MIILKCVLGVVLVAAAFVACAFGFATALRKAMDDTESKHFDNHGHE